jgi:integrase
MECLVLVLLGCGLRIGEALALRWSDIDEEAKRLRVAQAVGDLPGHMTLTRAERPRGLKSTKTVASQAWVPVPAFVLVALRGQRASVARQRLAAPAWDDQDLVFPTSVGTPKDRNNVSKEWLRLRAKAGLDDVRLHDLRHSTATFLLAAGAPMKLVQEVLRHSRMQTTADIYAHVLPEAKDEAGSLLDDYLAPPKKAKNRRKKRAL